MKYLFFLVPCLMLFSFSQSKYLQSGFVNNNEGNNTGKKIAIEEKINFDSASIKKLDSLFDKLAANNKAMGSFAFRQNGKLMYIKSTGFTMKAAEPDSAKSSTIYRIGSITKMYTAALIFKLIEQEKLKMETPLNTFFPSLPNADKITIRHMLGHKSGLFDITADSTYEKWYTKPISKDEMIRKLENQQPIFEPGQKTRYSNSNYILLGYIVEKITNKKYEQNLAAYINLITGAKQTFFADNEHKTASFSLVNDIWEKQKETDMSIPQGAGAISATAADVALFAEKYIDGKIINSAWMDTLLNVPKQLGYGIIKFDVEGEKGYGHNGAIDGFNTEVIYFPKQRMSLCFLSNGINYSIDEIMRAAFLIIQNKPYSIPSFKTITLLNEELQLFDGEYSSDKIPLKITVSHKDGKLYIQPTGQPLFAMDAETKTEFTNGQIGVSLQFILNIDNTVKEMQLKQLGGILTFKK